jgi:hypothetical protein
MVKVNNATPIDTEHLKALIRFAKPCGVSKFTVDFKNGYSSCMTGRAFIGRRRVLIRFSNNIKFPKKIGAYGGYLEHIYLDQDEYLVSIIAHELRHLWQGKYWQSKRHGMVHGARGKFSERDADAYAIRKQREWRKLNRKTFIPNLP